MRRSYKLNVDTAKLLTSSTISKTTSTSTTSSASSLSSASASPTVTITEDRTTTTTTSSPSTISSKINQNHISEKISLLEDLTTKEEEEKISRGIIFAMLGSLVVFIGIIVIIVFKKPSAKKPQPVEKEELIGNEVQPHRSLHV